MFNTAVKFIGSNWYTNERMVEIPYILRRIPDEPVKILEIGCSKSILAIHLSSLGHDVTGVDLHSYQFSHPNFEFIRDNILDVNFSQQFDYIISVSVLEHVGIQYEGNLLQLIKGIKELGCHRMMHTFPVCLPYEDKMLRSFTYNDIVDYFPKIIEEKYYRSIHGKFWQPITREEAMSTKLKRNPTGINVVGCFTFYGR